MNLKTWRFITILLAALAMGMKLAHTLELIPKLQFEPEFYIAVQTSLYSVFGKVGPFLELGALVAAIILAYKLRHRKPAFQYTLVSVITIVCSLAVFLIFAMPANAHINEWSATQVMPDDWMHWAAQWQYAQMTTFILHLIGFSSLITSVIREASD